MTDNYEMQPRDYTTRESPLRLSILDKETEREGGRGVELPEKNRSILHRLNECDPWASERSGGGSRNGRRDGMDRQYCAEQNEN